MTRSATCRRTSGLVLCCAVVSACLLPAGSWAAQGSGQLPPVQAAEFTKGPGLSPAAAALDFLDRLAVEAPEMRVRLPVSITLDKFRLSIVDARLGEPGEAPGRSLRLDDGSLGIGLADRARDLCTIGQRCVMRLVGYWRGSADGVSRFDVRRVDGVAHDTTAPGIEVEAQARR